MASLQSGEDRLLGDRSLPDQRDQTVSAGMAEIATDAHRDLFLRAMRRVASSVAVVTTDGPAGRFGATVSAFASVSADPPTVLVCLHSARRICAAVHRNRVFTLSVLAEGDEETARIFAGERDSVRVDRFAGIPLRPFPGLAPGLDGVASFACTLSAELLQHTHAIMIGEVAQVATARHLPLLYHAGAYAQLARAGHGCEP